jgi:hypothetical protein
MNGMWQNDKAAARRKRQHELREQREQQAVQAQLEEQREQQTREQDNLFLNGGNFTGAEDLIGSTNGVNLATNPSQNAAPPMPPLRSMQACEEGWSNERPKVGKAGNKVSNGKGCNGKGQQKKGELTRTSKATAAHTQAKARRQHERQKTVTTILNELGAGAGGKGGGGGTGEASGVGGAANSLAVAAAAAAGRAIAKGAAGPKKAQRPVFQANPFVVPTEKRRDKLRWEMRVRLCRL